MIGAKPSFLQLWQSKRLSYIAYFGKVATYLEEVWMQVNTKTTY